MVHLTRRSTFSSSHRLHSIHLSDEENKRVFDKCNRINGHGHNYTLEVTIRAGLDPKTGMIMNLVELKDLIDTHIVNKVDHLNLNMDVPEFKTLNPTVETLTVVFWDWLAPHLEPGFLYQIKLWETENNIASYFGQ